MTSTDSSEEDIACFKLCVRCKKSETKFLGWNDMLIYVNQPFCDNCMEKPEEEKTEETLPVKQKTEQSKSINIKREMQKTVAEKVVKKKKNSKRL